MPTQVRRFPIDFQWGVSCAGYQTDGYETSQFADFAHRQAGKWSKAAGPKHNYGSGPVPPEVWPLVEAEAKDPDSYLPWPGNSHYELFAEDMQLVRGLGNLTVWRFSTEWSELTRAPGDYVGSTIRYYRRYIDEQIRHGLEPWLCLQHFTLPTWAADGGGWLNADLIDKFADYAGFMAREFPQVMTWLTINEPQVWALMSCGQRLWPPKGMPWQFKAILRNMAEAHKRAYDAIKRHNPDARIGVAENNSVIEPVRRSPLRPLNSLAASTANKWYNWYFRDRTIDQQDFLALQLYQKLHLNPTPVRCGEVPLSDLGWELHPEALGQMATLLWERYHKPIAVTEHGCADKRDLYRPQYIMDSLAGLHSAILDGADIFAYLHWSWGDNIEWDKGRWPRFGLIEIDYQTRQRTPRRSAYLLGEIANKNSL